MNGKPFLMNVLRSWMMTFAVAGALLLSGCGSAKIPDISMPDISMPDIKLSSLWPSRQEPPAPVDNKSIKNQPQKPVAVQPVPQQGPTVKTVAVETENLPSGQGGEPMPQAVPGWLRRPAPAPAVEGVPAQEASAGNIIRFSPVPPRQGVFTPPENVPPAALPSFFPETGPVSAPVISPSILPETQAVAALLVPLSGRNADLGRGMMQASAMSVFDVGVSGFELRPYDVGEDAQAVEKAARAAVADGASIILGPVFASDAAVAKPIAQTAGIPVVTFSTDWTVAGDGTYVFGFLPFTQVIRVLSHAGETGIGKVAVLAPVGTYGDAVVETAKWQAARQGLVITGIGRYGDAEGEVAKAVASISDFEKRAADLASMRQQLEARGDDVAKAYLAKLEGSRSFGNPPCDAVLIAQGGSRLKEVLAVLSENDMFPPQVQFLGTGLWDDAALWNTRALAGAWFAAPSQGPRRDFERRYQQTFGAAPPRLATLAYDATALAVALYRNGRTPDAANLQSVDGFSGIDGIFRFRSNGLSERGLPVLEIGSGRVRVVSEAPQTFRQGVR